MSEIRTIKPYTADLSVTDDIAILTFWKLKYDTQDIARKLRRPEWQIANRLLHLREVNKPEQDLKSV